MSEYKANALNDDDLMTWSKYRGQRLGDVPDSFWRWFLKQGWSSEKPEYVDYASLVDD